MINKLYQQILQLPFQNYSVQVLNTFKKVVGVIVLAKVPLHRSNLYHFLEQLQDGSSIGKIVECDFSLEPWRSNSHQPYILY